MKTIDHTYDAAGLKYTYDANGNVSELIDAEGAIVAHYGPDPYGNPIDYTYDASVEDNPFRFSTKFWNAEVGLYDYGYRLYSPLIGRWVARDPIGEDGGLNHYIFGANDPLGHVDPVGMDSFNFTGGSVTFKPSWDIWPRWHSGATVADTLTASMIVDPASRHCAGNPSGCCVELYKNTVDMSGRWWGYWWIIGAVGHEAFHVGRFKSEGWQKLIDYARSKEGCYRTSAGASCWKSVVENQAAAYYLALAWLKSHELDAGEPNYATRHAVFQSAHNAAQAALTAKEATCAESKCAE